MHVRVRAHMESCCSAREREGRKKGGGERIFAYHQSGERECNEERIYSMCVLAMCVYWGIVLMGWV